MDLDDDGTFEAGTDEQVVYYYEGPSVYEKNVSLTKDTPVKFRVRYSQGSGGQTYILNGLNHLILKIIIHLIQMKYGV